MDVDIVGQFSGLALTDQWSLVGGIILPFLIAWIIKQGWTVQRQTQLQVGVCTIWGLLGAFANGDLAGFTFDSAETIFGSVLRAVFTTWIWYNTVYKAFPWPQRLEAATGGDPLVNVAPNKNIA